MFKLQAAPSKLMPRMRAFLLLATMLCAAFLLVTAACSSSPDMPLRAVVLSAQSSVFGRMFTYKAKTTFKNGF